MHGLINLQSTINYSDKHQFLSNLLIQDKQVEVEKESKIVTELQQELERLPAD